jgi:hypothetical protein
VTSFDIGAAYVNINSPEDIEIAEKTGSFALNGIDST